MLCGSHDVEADEQGSLGSMPKAFQCCQCCLSCPLPDSSSREASQVGVLTFPLSLALPAHSAGRHRINDLSCCRDWLPRETAALTRCHWQHGTQLAAAQPAQPGHDRIHAAARPDSRVGRWGHSEGSTPDAGQLRRAIKMSVESAAVAAAAIRLGGFGLLDAVARQRGDHSGDELGCLDRRRDGNE